MNEDSRAADSALEWVSDDSVAGEILDAIHVHRPGAPALHLTPFAAEELAAVERDMRERHGRGERIVIANVRMFGKTREQIAEWTQKWKKIVAVFPELAGVIPTIIHSEETKRGLPATESSIRELVQNDALGVPVVPMNVDASESAHFWTASLNGPAAVINEVAKRAGVPAERVWMLNMSFETDVSDDDVRTIAEAVRAGVMPMSVRDAGENVPRFKNAQLDTVKDRTRELVTGVLDWLQEGSEKRLRPSRVEELATLGRNTLSCIPLDRIVEAGGYDPFANENGGMEDLRIRAQWFLKEGREGSLETARQNVLRSLDFVIPYEDRRLRNLSDPLDVAAHKKKSLHEVKALFAYASHPERSFLKQLVVPEEKRDFRLE